MKYDSIDIVILIEDLIEYSIKAEKNAAYEEHKRIAKNRLVAFFDEVLLRE